MDSSSNVAAPTGAIRTHSRSKTSGSIAKRACDQCKFRKIKCSLSQPCQACVSMGFECTFFQPQKKRGPTGHRVSQIRQQQNQVLRRSPQGSPTSLSDAYPYQAPQPGELGQSGTIPIPESDWTAHGNVAVPVNGRGLAPHPNSGAIPPAWGPDAAPIDSHSSSAMGWTERSDVEYWLPDNLEAQIPIFDFPGNNVYLKPSLPSIIQQDPDASGLDAHPIGSPGISTISSVQGLQSEPDTPRTIWPPSVNEANMIPWIDVYFDRLHPTLPVLNRSSLFTRMLAHEHRKNSQFGSMLLSLCAFSLTQPIEINERPTSSSRASQARMMMHEATKMRSCSDFGEHPTIEAILTSFFLFGCLFGSNQHNAAWLRLREALDLAATLGLNNSDSYHDLPSEEKGQRLRTYLVLSITERAYALQRRHPITFWGRPGFSMRPVHDFIHSATHSLVSGIILHNEKDAEGMMGLARLMELFDAIDEDVIDCWNRQCNVQNSYCQKLTEQKAITIHENLNRVSESERYRGYDWFERNKSASGPEQPGVPTMFMRETQCADVFITQKWLQNRVWLLCSTHGLLRAQSDRPELTFSYAVAIAESTLKICRSLRLSSMEAHGIGLVEKLYDIAASAINVLYNVNASLGNDYATASSTEAISGIPHPSGVSEATQVTTATVPALHSLSEDYLLLLNSFRGGNHPYLEKYKTQLNSLRGLGNQCTSWVPR